MPEPHSADDPAPDLSQEELDSARQQLSAYRELIEEVPEIYERKFRERLEPIQARNQELLEEGRVLEEQLAGRLPPRGVAPAPEALPPARAARAPVQLLPFHGARWRWLAFGSVAAFLLLGGGLLYDQREPRTAQAPPTRTSPRFANPPTQAPPAKAAPLNQRESPRPGELLKTRGLSWLEVRSLADTTLFMGNLQGTKLFPLERGLRISAGRPDLVTVQRHGEPAKTLGGIREIGWHSFAPLPFAPLPSSGQQAPLPKQQSPNP